MANTYKGTCFCGAVELEVTGDAAVQGYCHCRDCASWAAAPVNSFSLWSPDSLKITKGEENIATYNKTENSFRKFCKTCGGHLYSDHPNMEMVDVYANVIPDFPHKPGLHVFYGEKTLSVKDGLPKYKDMPSEFGGSGDTLDD